MRRAAANHGDGDLINQLPAQVNFRGSSMDFGRDD
jgi:hypothetical protein